MTKMNEKEFVKDRNVFKIDIRFKLIITILLIVFIASTSKGNYLILIFYFILGAVAVFLFKPLLSPYLKRTFAVFLFPVSISVFIPFANMGNILYSFKLFFFTLSIPDNGLEIFTTTIIKSFISVMILSALITASKDIELLHGLRKIYFPKMIVSIIFLMYRYLFLIRDEARAGRIAINSRVFRKSYHNVNKRLAFLAGSLFIKSSDRAENIYRSMESRGFSGDFYPAAEKKGIKSGEIIIMSGFILAAFAVKLLEYLKY
ncbi:MAG: cobalt ECF transporter T component CbiQ [Actinobacteria bacterium]|nr:cobalt ECF transporter T component CbiQ [Actinomycetota bacterium]